MLLAKRADGDSTGLVIRPRFLNQAFRRALLALVRDGPLEHRPARPANRLVLLNNDTIRA